MVREKKTEARIMQDMTFGEVLEKYPETAQVMMSHGLHCIGCHVASYETIKEGAKAHGMTDKQIVSMIDKMNKAARKNS